MTLKEITQLRNIILSLSDFMESNSDSDESGIREEMEQQVSEARKILKKESYKLHLRNELAKAKRKRKPNYKQ